MPGVVAGVFPVDRLCQRLEEASGMRSGDVGIETATPARSSVELLLESTMGVLGPDGIGV